MSFLDCFGDRTSNELRGVPRTGFGRFAVRMSDGLKQFLADKTPLGFVQWRKRPDTPFVLPVVNTLVRMRLNLFQLEDRVNPVNPIVAENLLPGTPQGQWDIVGSGDPTLQGFATDMSVNVGGTVQFKITDTTLAPYTVDIYRMGYYAGMGARQVATIPAANNLRVNQPAPLTDVATGLVDAGNWSTVSSWAVPNTAVSGIYFARLTRTDTGGASHIVFIVRNDDSRSDVLFQTSDTTWQAYNRWGGNSLYGGQPAGRAYAVSYNRPFNTRSDTPGGRDFVWGADYPAVRWMEANGYSVSYTSGVDTHRYGAELLEHKVFLSAGHDEYWSGQQRANVEAARDQGVNLMFLGGNDVYWRTRWATSIDASQTANRTMVCYKETFSNQELDPSAEWTGTFRDPRWASTNVGANNPENALTGTIFTVNRGPGGETGTPFTVPAEYANLRFWRSTSVATLTTGQVATLGDRVLGYEWNEDLDNGFRPAGLVPMSSTTQTVPEKLLDYGSRVGVGTATHSLTQYRAKSGALVFSAGTVQWSWGLDSGHDGIATVTDPAIQQATANVLADMGVQGGSLQPGLVRPTRSTDIAGPAVAITAPTNNSQFTAGVPVTITGTSADTGGGVVAVVEVSTDRGRTWHRATGRGSWSYTWTPSESGPTTLMARSSDDSANLGAAVGVGATVNFTATNSTGLVAAYSFNAGSGATLADASGNGNNGTISGATWGAGKYGSALSFDGVNNYVSIPTSATLNLASGMTIEAWVRPNNVSGYRTVVLKETSGGQVYSLYAAEPGQGPSSYLLTGTIERQSVSLQSLPLNEWSHVAVTYNGSQLNVYANGVLVSSVAATGNITTSNGTLRIGGNSIWGDYFSGLIDDVRVYNRPLTANELRVDLSTPIGGVLDGVVPTGAITSPTAGASVNGTVSVVVSASDNALVAGVQLLLNGVPVGSEMLSGPFTYSWNTTQLLNGSYTLTARIRDVAGNTITTAGVAVTVANVADTTIPVVVLRQPGAGTLLSGSTVLLAYAGDNVQVTGVQFKVNGVNVGSELTAGPYQFLWNTTGHADGDYTITAVARDAGGNLTTAAGQTVTVDNTAPLMTTRTPAGVATSVAVDTAVTATLNSDVDPRTVAFVMRDPSNTVVPGVVTYNPSTFTLTFTPVLDLNLNTTYTVTLNVRDLAGNPLPTANWSFATASTLSNVTIFNPTDTPAVASNADAAIELGVRFRSSMDGFITGVRFYKGALNTGTHVGKLWSSAGTLLGSVTFTGETATGWQQANFDTPVGVTANTTYVISYFAPNGGYATTSQAFATSGAGNGALVALSGPAAGGNGVYTYGAGGGFPNQSFGNTNYWVDAVFSSSLVDATPPTVLSSTPVTGAIGVSQGTTVVATLSEAVLQSTISFVLRDSANTVVPATWVYNDVTHVVTLTPSALLNPSSVYTVTLSGAADAAGNAMSAVNWSFTTGSADATPATVTARTPAPVATNVALRSKVTATFNEQVQLNSIAFTVRDANNNTVAGTVRYSETTMTTTFTPSADLSPSTVYTATLSGVADLAGNVMTTATWTFTTAAVVTNASLWNSGLTPAVATANDTAAVEVGMKFRVTADGYVTGVRFYKGAGNTGTHLGHLWDAAGNLLGSVTFTNESATGWQQVNFSAPIPVNAGTTYVVSYYAPNGGYSYTTNYFTADVTAGPLVGLSSADAGGNGVYRYVTGGGFPNQNFGSPNYFVDVIYANTRTDQSPPTLSARTPAVGATGVSLTSAVEVTINKDIQFATLVFTLKDASNATVSATVSYNATTRTATLAPNAALATGATYTVSVSGALDLAGNQMAAVSWAFTTAASAPTESLWDSGATPSVASANDTAAIELGVKFQSAYAGFVTGVRFYKGSGNTGTHLGRVWSAGGTLLGSGTFTGETATGWQTLTFDTPVAITSGTTYVVSYFAPNGGYAYSAQFFGSALTSGSLTALPSSSSGGNGVYLYAAAGGFPNQSFNATNYWVDVLFTTSLGDTTAPTVSARTPAVSATGVSRTAAVTVTFGEAVVSNTISVVVRDAGNNTVSGSLTYNSATRTATFTPAQPLNGAATYTVTVSGAADAAGNVMTTVNWSFTTIGTWVSTSAADFAAGTASGVQVTGDGRVGLVTAFRDEFAGTALSSSNWSTQNWSGSAQYAVSGGTLSLTAGMISSANTTTGVPVEGRVAFGASPFQHFGLATSLNDVAGQSWAIFSTGGGTSTLYARVNVNGTTQEVAIGTLSTAFNLYRIQFTATTVNFYVNDSLVASITAALSATAMRVVASDYNGATPLALDWVALLSYGGSGTLTSVAYDAGRSVSVQSVNWTATTPSGTSISVHMSVSADGVTWSDWTGVDNGVSVSGLTGRYLRYRVTLTTTNSELTPDLDELTVIFV